MAQIRVSKRTENSITMYIDGLDPNYEATDYRLAGCYIKKSTDSANDYSIEGIFTIPKKCKSTAEYPSGLVTFYGLEEGTLYDLMVIIGGIAGIGSVRIYGEATTYSLTANIESFTCSPICIEDYENFIASCRFTASDVSENASYEIWARKSGTSSWYIKTGSNIYEKSVKTNGNTVRGIIKVVVDSSGDYDFKLVISNKNTVSTEVITNITFEEKWIMNVWCDGETQRGLEECIIYYELRKPYPEWFKTAIAVYDKSGNNILYSSEADGSREAMEAFGTKTLYISFIAEDVYTAFREYKIVFNLRTYSSQSDRDNGGVPTSLEDTTFYTALIAEKPTVSNFSVEQDAPGLKSAKVVFTPQRAYADLTKYEIYACKDSGSWYRKLKSTVGEEPDDEITEVIGVDSFGEYRFKIRIYTENSDITETIAFVCNINDTSASRPQSWEWKTAIKSGETRFLTGEHGTELNAVSADEWNEFVDRIRAFRAYAAISLNFKISDNTDYTIADVLPNQEFTASIYNEAVKSIRGIQSIGAYLNYISLGTELTSELFNILKSELNAIP